MRYAIVLEVFLLFDRERDGSRARIIRDCITNIPGMDIRWIDASIWEDARGDDDDAVKHLIAESLDRAHIVAVLIGAKTSERQWLVEQIRRRHATQWRGMFGVYIHNIENSAGETDKKGINPLPADYRTVDWVNDDGPNQFEWWVESTWEWTKFD